MPWKYQQKSEQRSELVRQMARSPLSIADLCRRSGVSRQTAYKWRKRFRLRRGAELADKSRKPLSPAGQTDVLWLRRLRAFRVRRPTWGARKLQHELGRRFGPAGVPSVSTIGRWLKRWGLVRVRRRRLPGPRVRRLPIRIPSRCHEVWTVDFKGWYRVGDGTRVDPLTVRDLHSRYVLGIILQRSTAVAPTQRAFRRLFLQHGLPERIRCDNGTPFGAIGATGLTRLSAWWVKLGIQVEFITPGRPCENGSHEQFHRVYKAEVAQRPEQTMRAQQRRSNVWLRDYNEQRPHEGLGMKRPAEVYTKNSRRLPKSLQYLQYPSGWERRWVKGNGEITWRGIRRFVGEAFVRDFVGMKPIRRGQWRIYFGQTLVGELYEKEVGSIRMAKYRRRR